MILKINFRDRITKNVLRRMHTELHFLKDMMTRKMKYAGHLMRGFIALADFRGAIRENKKQGRPKDTWIQDMLKWTGRKTYEELKRATEDRDRWKLMVVNLRMEDDK